METPNYQEKQKPDKKGYKIYKDANGLPPKKAMKRLMYKELDQIAPQIFSALMTN